MSNYVIRLDDACEKMNRENWLRMQVLLDKYKIKPLVGVIPHCEDAMMDQYERDPQFWDRVKLWEKKGWRIAIHGFNHVCETESGGVNPVNKRSEFAGQPLFKQKEKIKNAVSIMEKYNINANVFFAPSHTFDKNTIIALKECSNIRIISDTIAGKPYNKYGITFIPQQSGKVRKLPFSIVTFCYHPNQMEEDAFKELEKFLKRYQSKFVRFPEEHTLRKRSLYDIFLEKLYFARR